MNYIRNFSLRLRPATKIAHRMMEHFLEKYGAKIKVYGHQMQSLDYKVIEKVREYDTDIPVYFILPYNSVFS